MDSVINKLTEIEETALSIVAHAEEEKEKLSMEYEKKRKEFDQKLEEETMARIAVIQEGLEHDKKGLLTGQESASRDLIVSLQKEYEEKHKIYAEDILRRITEV